MEKTTPRARARRAAAYSAAAAGILAACLFAFTRPRVERLVLLRDSRRPGTFAFAAREVGAGGVSHLGSALWLGPVAGVKERKLFEFPDWPEGSFDVEGDHVLAWDGAPGNRRCWLISRTSGAVKEIPAPPGDRYTLFDGSIIAIRSQMPSHPGDPPLSSLRRFDLNGEPRETVWEGASVLGEPWRFSGGMAVSGSREGRSTLLFLPAGSGEPVELPFPGMLRPFRAHGRFWWLTRRDDGGWTLSAGDPDSGGVTEAPVDAGYPLLIPWQDRLYIGLVPAVRHQRSTLAEVLPDGSLSTVGTGLPRYSTAWIQDGFLHMVVEDVREDWWDWSARGLSGWREWTLQRFRLPG